MHAMPADGVGVRDTRMGTLENVGENMEETDECVGKPELKMERKTEDLVKPAKITYPFAWMDPSEVCMVATQSVELDALIRSDSFSGQEAIVFNIDASPSIDSRFNEKDARSTFAIEYLEKMLQIAKKCGAKQLTLTLRTDFPLRMEFESKDKTALHDSMLRTAFLISPIVDDGKPKAEKNGSEGL